MIDSTYDPSSPHVALVVDDDSRIRAYIKVILQTARIRVLEAGDGIEALQVFRVWHGVIDLVITDIRMPRMTGTDFADSLRLDSPGIPLIFVSGESAPPAINGREKALFIEKPFAPKALLDAARRFLN